MAGIQEGVYTFWYCQHDEGVIVYTPLISYNQPKWINNLCYCNDEDINKSINKSKNNDVFLCDYQLKGQLKYNKEGITELKSVQRNYEKEAGGWKFEYYLHNVFNIIGKNISSDALTKAILEWFSNTIQK